MSISRFAKAILYLAVTVVLLIVSTVIQMAMHTTGGIESAYFRSDAYIFITATACLGIAVYSFYAYTRRHREHQADSLFLLLTGLVLMALAVFILINFGGLSSPFTETGFTAANVNIILMTLMPLPFFIRGLVLAFSTHSDKRSQRSGILVVCVIVAAVYVAALAGGMMRMVHYETDSSYSSGEVSETAQDDQAAA